jgi:hypothetical protein
MRNVLAAVLAGVAIAAGAMLFAQKSSAAPDWPAGGGSAPGELVVLSCTASNNHQQITVVNPREQTICVYHVEFASGAVALKSVRNIAWDMKMDVYDSPGISPREIRELLQAQQR